MDTEQYMLQHMLAEYGEVKAVQLARDNHTDKPEGYGFVDFTEAPKYLQGMIKRGKVELYLT